MKFRPCFALIAAALTFCAVPGWSRDYQLKHPNIPTGTKLNVESNMAINEAEMAMSVGGQSLKGTMTMSSRKVQVSKITAGNGGLPTEVETHFKEATEKQTMTLNGQANKDEKNEPLHGATVISKLVNGKWDTQLKNGQPTAEQKAALLDVDDFGADDLYEDRAIAVGQMWNVPPERVQKLLGDAMASGATGTIQCKLDRVENYNGRPCAVIAFEIKLSGKPPGEEATDMKVHMDLKGTVFRSVDEKVDMKVDLGGKIKMEGSVPGVAGSKMEVIGPMTMTQVITFEK